MLTGSAGAEVKDHSFQRRERLSAVSQDISAVIFLLPWRKYLYSRLVGVDNLLSEHCLAQGINQRLKLYTRLANQLRQS